MASDGEPGSRSTGSTSRSTRTRPADEPGTVAKFTVTVPAGTKAARFATFTSDHQLGTELDMYVYKDGNLVAQAPAAGPTERVTVPEAGTYEIYIAAVRAAAGRRPRTT